MKRKIGWAAFLTALLLSTSAMAETVTLDGTVTAAYTQEIYAAAGGILESVPVTDGQTVTAGDTIASFRTTKVCAEQDGTITAVFGQVGDLTDTVAAAYGAAIYLESAVTYTVSASTQNAYDAVENKVVHVGEKVYLRSRSEDTRTGEGIITSLSGTDYTINVTAGDFLMNESVNVYRAQTMQDPQRIGRGTIGRNTPISVTGTGRIVKMNVQAGDAVQRGDVLMETLNGSAATAQVLSTADGIVAQVAVTQGSSAAEDDVLAVIWPTDAMVIEAKVTESDLGSIHVGGKVSLAFRWNDDTGETLDGIVEAISGTAETTDDETSYMVRIRFIPDETVRYGMNVTITTAE